MNGLAKLGFYVIVFITSTKQYAQHSSKMEVELNPTEKTLHIKQEVTFFNQSSDTLKTIVLNDWNNAYSAKNTPLAKRFSDEFYRGFHLAKKEERGSTNNLNIVTADQQLLLWYRPEQSPDYIILQLNERLPPKQKITFLLNYSIKIPSDKFTRYGYTSNGSFYLKNWYITAARYENNAFVKNSNNNLDDIANGICNFEINLKIPSTLALTSDLTSINFLINDSYTTYQLSGINRTEFSLILEPKSKFVSYKNEDLEVETDLKDNRLNEIQKAKIINQIVNFSKNLIGDYAHKKVIVSQVNYDRNPFYGLNQLPPFLSPFPDEFIYEIKFLKTYLNEFLKTSLYLNPRKDNWIYDGIQVYAMMKYIDKYHPDTKMIGSIAKIRLLQSFHLAHIDFNSQYSYFYMLMARKNLDQALSNPKNSLIKFNEQIASKYRAGLSLRFLDDYLQNNIVTNSIQDFYKKNQLLQVSAAELESSLKSNTSKNICWFFNSIINSRTIIDYKFSGVTKTKDSITFSVINRTAAPIPIPIYGTKNGSIIFKKWLDIEACDSTFTIPRYNIDKLILNLKNEVPEYNLRNNWKKLEGVFPNNRPIKFIFMKDLEDPYYNQILYVPSFYYNLYDGLAPGIRLHNKTILDKSFIFDVNPSYSTKSNILSGSAVFAVNQNSRNSRFYNTRYSISGSYFHYVEDATYLRLNPSVQLRIREQNFRDNQKQLLSFRQVIVNKEKSAFILDNSPANYSVFDARYINTKTEVTNHFNFVSNIQVSGNFGKVSTEIEYRRLFEDNRQLNLRLYMGKFLYNKTQSDFFSFALDRPTDYLFDYNYLGRSESSGLFSQQYIIAEGGFKSKIATPFANRWITSLNASYSIWNWIEVYGDIGLLKNTSASGKFVFDSGIRLNLVTDYFELYFPVHSNNGWEITQNSYEEKIRFIFAFSPQTLINLFNRKWF